MAERPTALVLGGSGMLGGVLLRAALSSRRYERVVALARRPIHLDAPGLIVEVRAPESFPERARALRANHVYCCIGASRRAVGGREQFRQVDHDLVAATVLAARRGGASRLALASVVGACEYSRNYFYTIKGRAEQAVISADYEACHIFRPFVLVGSGRAPRLTRGARAMIGRALWPFLVGRFSLYRPTDVHVMAKAMVSALTQGAPGVNVHHWRSMNELAAAAENRRP